MRSLDKDKVNGKHSGKIFFFSLLSWLILLGLLTLPGECRAESSLNSAWLNLVNLENLSPESLQSAIDQFRLSQQQNNIKNASIYSLALLKMAEVKKISPEVKRTLTRAAISISPDYSFPETAYCRLMFRQHKYLKSLASLVRASYKFIKNPLENLYASTFFWLALSFIPLSLLFFSALFFSVKYYRAFSEMGDLKLSHNGGLTTLFLTIALAMLIIFLPAPLLGLLILSVALSLFATRRDILILTLLTTSLLIVPFTYEKGMASLLALDSSFFKTARFSTSGIEITENENVLNKPATNQSQLALQLFSQAEAARRRREYAKAEIFLKKIISNKIELGAAYNNLANLYILQGNYKASEALFIKAANLEKNSGIPYYNLSITYIQQHFDLRKSSRALEMAFKRDPKLSLIKASTDNSESELRTGVRLLFMNLPDDFYSRYADTQSNRAIYLPEFLRQVLFPGANKIIYLFLVVLSIGALAHLFREAPTNRRICSDCGRLFHPVRIAQKKRCPLCYMNKNSTAGTLLLDFSRIKKDPTLQHLSNIILVIISLLFPGFYPFLTGHTLAASGLMLAATLWLYNFFICQTAIMAPFPPATAWFSFVFPFLVWSVNLIFLIVLIASQKRHHTFLRSMS